MMKLKKFAQPKNIRENLIGNQNHVVEGPFGPKPIVYADTTASGRALSYVEDYIRDCVYPLYANTHTEASATGLQTQRYREDARDAIREACKAPRDEYAVIFCGSGSTGAMNKLANVLGISPLAAPVEDPSQRAVVFISSQEHHSNELLWRDSPNTTCVVVPQVPHTGLMDETELSRLLVHYQDRPIKLASFSAASNVTGIRCDTENVTRLLHQHGVLAVWDFAAAGPHVAINMKDHDMDGIYLSPHKYAGGPGTPGVLIARRSLFTNGIPTVPGGGTVDFVQPHGHKYTEDIESREEGGTPAIVDSIRCGLVLQLHSKVGGAPIEQRENVFLQMALKSWKANPNIVLLGNTEAKRVPIVSFLVKANGGLLHHNFVVTLLNDLFGIQARGGCSCAGPYGHLLLDIDAEKSDYIIKKMEALGESIKPGWSRLGFSYYMSNETVKYIIDAVNLVADEGYKLLPRYSLNAKNGAWVHNEHQPKPMRLWDFDRPYSKPVTSGKKDLKACLKYAKKILKACGNPKTENVSPAFLSKAVSEVSKDITWFVVPRRSLGGADKELSRSNEASETDELFPETDDVVSYIEV